MTPSQFKQWRTNHDLSYTQMAKTVGVCATSIRKYEQGTRPITKPAVLILKLLDTILELSKKQKNENSAQSI